VDLLERAHRVAEVRGEDASDPEAYIKGLRDNTLVGTVAEIGEQLSVLEDAGVQRVMFQHLTHNDLDGVDLIAELAE
jgi:hypothetical protein